MTPKEKILSILAGETGHSPVAASILSAVTFGMMDECGACWPDAHNSAELMARLASQAAEMCGWASLKLPFDMMVEVEALGGGIDYGDRGTLPQAKGHLLEWGKILETPDDFAGRGRVPVVTEAIRIAKARQKDAAVIASLVGPFALAGKLYGTEEIMMATILEPEMLEEALCAVCDFIIKYANILADAGADAILMGDPTSSGDLISSKTYEKFVLPLHARIARDVKAPVILHICGKIDGHLPHIAKSGLAGLSFDYKTDFRAAKEHLKGKMALIGWVDPLGALLSGTPKEVYDASMECLRGGVDILSPGCALPPATPVANMRAMAEAAADFAAGCEKTEE